MDIQSLNMDVICAATVAYHEGRTQNERIAIINVIYNRLKSGRWGNSVCSVSYARGQFIGVTDESHNKVDEKTYLQTKLLVLDTIIFHKYKNPVGKALYFHDDSIKDMSTAWDRKPIKKIDNLVFY